MLYNVRSYIEIVALEYQKAQSDFESLVVMARDLACNCMLEDMLDYTSSVEDDSTSSLEDMMCKYEQTTDLELFIKEVELLLFSANASLADKYIKRLHEASELEHKIRDFIYQQKGRGREC